MAHLPRVTDTGSLLAILFLAQRNFRHLIIKLCQFVGSEQLFAQLAHADHRNQLKRYTM
jgi:hypothetical protein